MDVAVLDARVLLKSQQVVVKSLLQLHGQFGWQICLHLLAHVFQVNACELLKHPFVKQVVLGPKQHERVVVEVKVKLNDGQSEALG